MKRDVNNGPDPIDLRCKICNIDGGNRTGLKPISFVGASTTRMYGIKCPNNCDNGLIK